MHPRERAADLRLYLGYLGYLGYLVVFGREKNRTEYRQVGAPGRRVDPTRGNEHCWAERGTTGHQVIAGGAKEEFLRYIQHSRGRAGAVGAGTLGRPLARMEVLGSPQRSHNDLINIKLDPERR